MLIKLQICDLCYLKLHRYGIAVEVYEDFLESYITNHESILVNLQTTRQMPIIVWLETKGYVATTDYDDNRIAVKPLGIKFDGDDCHVCLDRKSHG